MSYLQIEIFTSYCSYFANAKPFQIMNRLCIVLIHMNKFIQILKSHFKSISSIFPKMDGASAVLVAILGELLQN